MGCCVVHDCHNQILEMEGVHNVEGQKVGHHGALLEVDAALVEHDKDCCMGILMLGEAGQGVGSHYQEVVVVVDIHMVQADILKVSDPYWFGFQHSCMVNTHSVFSLFAQMLCILCELFV